MNRCIEVQNHDEYASHNPMMVDGGIAQIIHEGNRQHVIPSHVLEYSNVRLEYDQAAGWPPKLSGGKQQQCLTSSRTEVSFDLQAQHDYRKVALKHAEVVSHLAGRWETLGVHLVSHRDTPCQIDTRARVCFFNYTSNKLIEAYVEDGVVTSVRMGESYQHPEAPVEMAQAIALARVHPDIKDVVESLSAHAILRVPMDPSAPSYRHRCLLVMFTDQDDEHRELPVLFSALVDLCEQRVLAFSSCSCSSDVGQNHHDRTD